MATSWNMLRLFCMYFILSMQYSFNGASPLIGPSVNAVPLGRFFFVVSLTNKTLLHLCRTAALLRAGELVHFCGGSLITPYHVLTAAHCLVPFNEQFDKVEVAIKSTDLSAVEDVRQVSWWITFSKFSKITIPMKKYDDMKDCLFDIAIIKLETPVKDVELPTISYIPTEKLYNKSVVIAGWGLNEENRTPRDMQMGKFTIVDPSAHPEIYNLNYLIRDSYSRELWSKISLFSDASATRARPGDSGSPLLYDGKNRDYPNNIVGVQCSGRCLKSKTSCRPVDMHMSTNIFRGFIESVTKITDDTLPTV